MGSTILPIRRGVDTSKTKERPAAAVVPLAQPMRSTERPCAICHGAGWLRQDVPVGHPKFGTKGLVRCACKDAEQRAKLTAMTYTWLGIDESALATKTFASFNPRVQPDHALFAGYLDYAQDYVARLIDGQAVENVLMKGGYGTGKTLLAAGILNAARDAGIPCLYTTAQKLFTTLYANDFDQRLIRLASTTRLLVLDEVDKYYAKVQTDKAEQGKYQKSTLGDIFDSRYQAGLPTILISNEQHDLTPWLDGWTLSRFLGNRRTLEMNGRDCRQGGAK